MEKWRTEEHKKFIAAFFLDKGEKPGFDGVWKIIKSSIQHRLKKAIIKEMNPTEVTKEERKKMCSVLTDNLLWYPVSKFTPEMWAKNRKLLLERMPRYNKALTSMNGKMLGGFGLVDANEFIVQDGDFLHICFILNEARKCSKKNSQ